MFLNEGIVARAPSWDQGREKMWCQARRAMDPFFFPKDRRCTTVAGPVRDDYISGPIIYNEPTRDVMCARDIHPDGRCGHELRGSRRVHLGRAFNPVPGAPRAAQWPGASRNGTGLKRRGGPGCRQRGPE
ncbi:hypothetical protein MRX96_032200 [Rhipicephalus microplus]